MDDAEKKKIKNVKIVGDKITVTLEAPISSLLEQVNMDRVFGYSEVSQAKAEVTRIVAEEIMKNHGKEIINEVLKDVNWADVVRSEIAARVIQEAASGRWKDPNRNGY